MHHNVRQSGQWTRQPERVVRTAGGGVVAGAKVDGWDGLCSAVRTAGGGVVAGAKVDRWDGLCSVTAGSCSSSG